MITRKMNQRITFFSLTGGQNDDGEVLEGVREDVWTCWAEVSKTSVKDFREKTGKSDSIENIVTSTDTKVFLIRYLPKLPFDNSMHIDFEGRDYKITAIEVDYANKEMIMVKGARVG
ncbi:phage head closure protein [Streptococcus pluranimalium]|uniref:phage head closure protein n=1 Tax=Streptococcus pluranimalium TaxID=82348 RepID=UPI003F668383